MNRLGSALCSSVVALAAAVTLSACGGTAGAGVEPQPAPNVGPTLPENVCNGPTANGYAHCDGYDWAPHTW
jgi:hypothetical protein